MDENSLADAFTPEFFFVLFFYLKSFFFFFCLRKGFVFANVLSVTILVNDATGFSRGVKIASFDL
jgi:hypothetical protein